MSKATSDKTTTAKAKTVKTAGAEKPKAADAGKAGARKPASKAAPAGAEKAKPVAAPAAKKTEPSKTKTKATAAPAPQKTPAKPMSEKPVPAKAESVKVAAPAADAGIKQSKASGAKSTAAKSAAPKSTAAKSAAPKSTAAKSTAPKSTAAKNAAARSAKTAAAAVAAAPAGPRPRLASGSSGPTLAPVQMAPAKVRTATPFSSPAAKAVAAARPPVPQSGFKAGDYIVYPAHGVGQILAVEKQIVAGFTLELFVINFLQDKMTLKVPLPKVLEGAIRRLSEPAQVKKALDTLTGRARIKRTMWSRRAQEYEAKINSGDLVTIAEVVRDLYRSDTQPEQSYSERQLYEAALDRMSREVAVVRKLEPNEALKLIEEHLQRGPRRGAKADAAGEEETAEKTSASEEGIGEAA